MDASYNLNGTPLNNIMNDTKTECVLSFYKGASVLVTGATGFLGKIVVEKLVRTCENVDTVYILIRPKNGNTVEQRYKDLLKSLVFEKIRNNNPELLNKIKPIKGDVSEVNIGMNRIDTELLMEKVDIVIHSAATIRFVETLQASLNMNTLGTKRLLELCCNFKKLKSFVYVSTAFSNPDIFDVKEEVYPSQHDPDYLIQLLSLLPKDTVNALSLNLQGGHPNTYTFTKNLAEIVSSRYFDRIPICIVRPSLVVGALSEPFPGWLDNLFGVAGILMEIYRGTVRTAISNKNAIVDAVPVDFVANTCITAAWHHRLIKKDSITVYNCTAGDVKKEVTWKYMTDLCMEMGRTHPTKYVTLYPNFKFTSNRLLNTFWEVLTHLIPTFLLDLLLRVQGKKPIMMKISRRVKMAMLAGEYFALHQWKFHVDNFHSLQKAISETGENVYFPCDMGMFDSKEFLNNYILGIRKYIMRDSMDSLAMARKKLQRLYIIQKLLQAFMGYLLYSFLFKRR